MPGIDATQLGGLAEKTGDGLLGLLNAFTGGAFANASVFALGIMPLFTSIVVQLMGIAIPYLQKLQKREKVGEKINQQKMAYYSNLFSSSTRLLASLPSLVFLNLLFY